MLLLLSKWSSLFHMLLYSSILLLSWCCAQAINPQGHALLTWKQSLNGSVDVLANWNPNDLNPCKWYGVSCDATGHVVELNLQYIDLLGYVPVNLSSLAGSLSKLILTGTNLSGPIPPQLGDLKQLTYLDLSGNALTGAIPDGLCQPGSQLERLILNTNRLEGSIPYSIGNLTALQWLIIYDNQLAGEIPPTIGQLANLEVFRAGGNKNLLGTLPAEIGNCSNLTMLGLAETSISGALPASLGQLKQLETLAIYTALLSGPIPQELGQCTQLKNIYLYENSLSGAVPGQLGDLQELQNLLLWQNNLVGVIPPELGKCRALEVVDLSLNSLTGKIPSSLGNLSALLELQVSVNQISGTIPLELANCQNLTDLELDNNDISGEIPVEICRLRNLRVLYLWRNRLAGSIPPEIGNCVNLEAMDLSENNLTGPIPRGVFRLPYLTKLLFVNNDLSGEIPPDIGHGTSLIRFRANGNRIAGPIPPEIGQLKNLSFLDLGSNRLTGEIPQEIAGCHNLTFIDLHGNAVSGLLPLGLFEGIQGLQYLDLSGNSISGNLSSEIGLLTSLTKLVLAGNSFSGQIPSEIGSCSKMQLLDLSSNSFSGEIPPSLGKMPGLEIAMNLSFNNLSGKIPGDFASLVRLGVLDLSHNQLTGDLQPLAGLQNLVSLNVSFNNFSGRVPDNEFFSKFPMGDFEGNPVLCLVRCSGDQANREKTHRAARVATAVLISSAVVLLGAAAIILISRRKSRLGQCLDEEKDGDMSPPWEVTLYQKLDISVGDLAKSLVAANEIGRGWSGSVYRAKIPPTGTMIAVKKFRAGDDAAKAAFHCEVGALSRVRHRNIVRLLGWAANRRTRLLFYDYLPNGTLGELIHGDGGGTAEPALQWEVRLGVAIGVADGLAYLHHDLKPGILHRDVKVENILLGERYEACLGDFGLARIADDEDGGRNDSTPPPFAGSYGYIAPEYGCMTKITKKSDVYSFGVVLLEMITGRRAVEADFGEGQTVVHWAREQLRSKRDPSTLVDTRLQGRPNTQVQEMLQALGIALLCASARPADRPTMKDVAALLREIRQDDSLPSEATKPRPALATADGLRGHLHP